MKSQQFKRYQSHRSKIIRNNFNSRKWLQSALRKDLLAMQQVWEMLKKGAITWIGEIGRQY